LSDASFRRSKRALRAALDWNTCFAPSNGPSTDRLFR
jgi:hypothetical protein